MLGQNLKALSINEFRFTFRLTLDEKLVSVVSVASPPDDDGDNVFLDTYKIVNISHLAIAVVSKVKKGAHNYSVDCRCSLGRGGRLKRGTPKISELFDILSAVKEPLYFNCLIRFLFGKRSQYKSIIQLPIKVTDKNDAIYNEIHGVHFVKMDGKRMDYEVIIDLLEGGGYTEAVIFGYRSEIDMSLMENIIGKATSISGEFVSGE